MKVIIFICLIAQFLGRIIYLKKYKESPRISYGSGLVVLDLSGFKGGDSIYITYDTEDGKYSKLIYYNFTTTYPTWEDPNLLQGRQNCYSDGYTSIKHNVSDGWGGYRIYYTYNYHYFFEFKKPVNETANFLLLGYDLTGYHLSYLKIDNTRFRRYIKTVIIVCSIGGGILFFVGIYFLIKKKDDLASFCSRCCDCDCDCSDCCDSLFHRTHSSLIIKTESKSLQLMEDSSSTSNEMKYDNKRVEEKPYCLPENHPDYIKPSEEIPQYYPPIQNNLIDKPIATDNVIPPTSLNIVVETPIPQPQQNLGPVPPPVYQVPVNINNSQTPLPPKPEEYPSQEMKENNSFPPSNQDINIPPENNDNFCLLPSNQEQIQPQDNTNNNQNPPQNVENNNNGNNFTGGGGIYQ